MTAPNPSPDQLRAAKALLDAAKTYCERYLQDERAVPEYCLNADHHRDICALFDAVEQASASLTNTESSRG